MKSLQPSNNKILIAIMFLAVALRLGAAFYLGEAITGVQQDRIQDQVSYNALARSLIAGRGYTFDKDWYPSITRANQPTAHWSFLYPLYLAGVYALAGYRPLIARLLQGALSGILLAWLLYRLGRRLFGEPAGLVSAGLGAVYIYFICHDAALMTESFFILGVLVSLDLALQIGAARAGQNGQESEPPLRLWIRLGIVLGLTALLRQTILLWLPFLLLWIFCVWRGKLRLSGPAVCLGVMGLLILPWTARNYGVYHAFLPLNSNAGYALYSANHPYHGTQFDQDYAADLPADLIGQGLNEAQWNTELTRRGLQFISQDPRRYLLLSLDRVGIFFNFWFSPESSLSSNLMRVLSFGLYLPFFIYGILICLLRRTSSASRLEEQSNLPGASLLLLFALVFSAMHVFTWASIRYRLPVDAAMMPFAALAVVDLVARLRLKRGLNSLLPVPDQREVTIKGDNL